MTFSWTCAYDTGRVSKASNIRRTGIIRASVSSYCLPLGDVPTALIQKIVLPANQWERIFVWTSTLSEAMAVSGTMRITRIEASVDASYL